MKKNFATFIVTLAIVGTTLVSCEKEVPTIIPVFARDFTMEFSTAIDVSITKSTNILQGASNLCANQKQP